MILLYYSSQYALVYLKKIFLGLGDDPLDDELPYTLITYANGPGFYNNIKINNDGTNVTRLNLSDTDFINDREYRYTSSGIRDSATVGILQLYFEY
jgi:hypothetical protein